MKATNLSCTSRKICVLSSIDAARSSPLKSVDIGTVLVSATLAAVHFSGIWDFGGQRFWMVKYLSMLSLSIKPWGFH